MTTTFNRRAVADRAMKLSIAARQKAKKDLVSPVCIYDLAAALGVDVRFNDINMEGMFQQGSPPRIHLSALRPLARRTFNCAHELGHYQLGHGSSIDELRENQQVRPWDIPEEYGADTFASYMLMPTLGLRNAFVTRGFNPATASPADLYRIACHFGVGYRTLITHLLYGAAMIDRARAGALLKASLPKIREEILGAPTARPLVVADHAWKAPTIDVEVGHLIQVPAGAVVEGASVRRIADIQGACLFEAVMPGLSRLCCPDEEWAAFVRVARTGYVGRAQFRHLEEVEYD